MSQDPTWGEEARTARPNTDTEWADDQSGGADPQVERLAGDIERTRGDMTETLEELGDRLNPANVIQDAKATVREATVGKVEAMANNAQMTARETGEGLIETIKRNPLPAALAGIGIGWLWMSRDKGPSWSAGNGRRNWSMAYPAGGGYGSSGYGSAGYGETSGITDRIGEAGQQVGRTASEVASGVGSTASDVAERARETASRVPDQVGEVGQQVGDTAQRVLEDNPLAVGAVALAVGAVVGLALPATRTEERMVGQKGAQLIDQAAAAASKPVERLEEKMTEVEADASTASMSGTSSSSTNY